MDTKEKCLTKGKEYIIKSLKGNAIVFESDFDENHDWDISEIDTDFTIKRYTLTDLKEKKIAVKLRNYEEYKRLCEAVGDKNSGVDTYGATDDYFGNDNFNGNSIVFLTRKELEGRILVPSIDLIDLEVKEEVVNECEISPLYVDKLESEINRLKGENEKLTSDLGIAVSQLEILQLRESPQISQNLEKRERMAWELVVHSNIQYEKAFEMVKDFLAKSNQI